MKTVSICRMAVHEMDRPCSVGCWPPAAGVDGHLGRASEGDRDALLSGSLALLVGCSIRRAARRDHFGSRRAGHDTGLGAGPTPLAAPDARRCAVHDPAADL